MQRILIPVLAVAVALAGCIGQETQRTGTDDGGTGGGASGGGNVSAGAGANVTAGNTTGNATGNATIGTVGNATAGNETGNQTQEPVQPRQLSNETYSFAAAPPAEVTFLVDQPYSRLVVNVTAEGLIADLKVTLTDGGGNETVAFQGTVAGGMDPKSTAILRPALGTWMITFEGTGAGSVEVAVRGE